jgi:DNA-binding NtrC family response regulator
LPKKRFAGGSRARKRISRRDWRTIARAASQAVARPAGTRVCARRRNAAYQAGRSIPGGDQQGSAESRARGNISRGLVSPAECDFLALPALREHSEDIPLLAEYFAARYAKKCNRVIQGISTEARASLLQYDWPGNIRELENAMERAVVIGSTECILPEDLPEALLESAPAPADSGNYHEAVRNLKKQLILSGFEQAGGSITEAAKLLGVNSNYLHRLIRNLDLRVALKKNARAQ